MKKSYKIISVLLLVCMIFSMGTVASFAADDESKYVATFKIDTGTDTASKGQLVTVNVKLKTNYYIYAISLPVIYDATVFEVQNTSSVLNSFLTFKGSLAGKYITNGNWKSPDTLYSNRNSNPEYWNKTETKNKYKILTASWTPDSTKSTKTVKLTNEETIVSFVLKATASVSDMSKRIFINKDFLKTKTFPGGNLFVGRSKTETLNTSEVVTVGQTINVDASIDTNVNTDSGDISINFRKTANLKDKLISSFSGKTVEWTSSDGNVVAVDDNGNIKGTGIGSARIIASSSDGRITQTFNVKVSYSIFQWFIVIVLFGWIWYK